MTDQIGRATFPMLIHIIHTTRAALGAAFDHVAVQARTVRHVIAGLVLAASTVLMARYGATIPGWIAEVWAMVAAVPPAYVLAACGLKAAEVMLNTGVWLTVLRTSHPGQDISFRQALGVVQGGIGIVAVIPPKFGGMAVLGLYRAAFPALGITALIATRTVQGIAASVLGIGVLMLFGASTAGDPGTLLTRAADVFREQPLLAITVTVLGTALLTLLIRRGRTCLRSFGQQLAQGGAILRTPASTRSW